MRLISKLIREPFIHFLLLGSCLYAAATLHARMTTPHRIVVSDAITSRITERYKQQFGALPSPERLAYLIDKYVQDEALYRRGVEMGLGNDDEIVRRRIIQKMEFIGEGDSDPGEPTEQQLRAYFQAHGARYRVPGRISFNHIYFSADRDSEKVAHSRAIAMLGRLNASPVLSPVTSSGDAFPDRLNFALADQAEITRTFGQGGFVQALFSSPVGRWSGPIRSNYGWHIVWVQALEAPHAADFATVAEDVRTDWRKERETVLKQEMLNRIVGQYEVIRENLATVRATHE